MPIYIKQNDTLPTLESTLTDDYGVPIDLTGCTAVFRMQDEYGVHVLEAAAGIENPTSGVVTYSWASGDTANHGLFLGEFKITFEEVKLLTAPNGQYIEIVIVKEVTGPDL